MLFLVGLHSDLFALARIVTLLLFEVHYLPLQLGEVVLVPVFVLQFLQLLFQEVVLVLLLLALEKLELFLELVGADPALIFICLDVFKVGLGLFYLFEEDPDPDRVLEELVEFFPVHVGDLGDFPLLDDVERVFEGYAQTLNE